MRRKKNPLAKRQSQMNLFYLPAIFLFLCFVVYPFVDGLRISFTRWNGYSQNYTYIGFANYARLFQDAKIGQAFTNTLIYGFGSTIIQNIVGLSYALLLNTCMKGRSLVRTVVYMPVMIASLIMGYIMYFLFQYNHGALNDILLLLGKPPVDWLADGGRAVLIITIINSLHYVGNDMVLYLAGLQAIPSIYYEAATIDGVGPWGCFRYITLPLLMPALTSVITLNVIGGLKMFDIIIALTNGGPGWASHSLSTMITYQYFRAQNAGYSAAIGFLSFLFIMVISNFIMMLFRKREVSM